MFLSYLESHVLQEGILQQTLQLLIDFHRQLQTETFVERLGAVHGRHYPTVLCHFSLNDEPNIKK